MSEWLISHGVLVFWLVARLLLRASECFNVVAKVIWVVARWSLKAQIVNLIDAKNVLFSSLSD